MYGPAIDRREFLGEKSNGKTSRTSGLGRLKKRGAFREGIGPVIEVAGIEHDLERLEDHLRTDWFADRHLPPRSPAHGANRATSRMRQGGTRGVTG